MDSKTKWLIIGFVYLLGALGMFLITFFDARVHLGSDMQAVEEAVIAAVTWPFTVIKIIFKFMRA